MKRSWSYKFLAAAAVAAALAGGAYQYYRHIQARNAAAQATENAASMLSPGTEAVLSGLKSPVEIHFYSLLDPATTPESTRAFADRVSELLAKYEQDGKGNVRIVRYSEMSDANAKAAAVDGIHSFNRDKGEASYLGIAAVRDGLKQAMPELSPEWEQALESDLSRMMARVNEMTPPNATPANVSATELATAQKAIASNPALATASLEQGSDLLREQALAEFKAAVTDMQNQSKAAEEKLSQGSASESEVAGELKKIQAEQTAKMQEITARLHNQLAALTQSKGVSR
jgi:ABC-type uncharacterized transport system involved in gliding motility auxiliary subunit